jgi:hypothetical protein
VQRFRLKRLLSLQLGLLRAAALAAFSLKTLATRLEAAALLLKSIGITDFCYFHLLLLPGFYFLFSGADRLRCNASQRKRYIVGPFLRVQRSVFQCLQGFSGNVLQIGVYRGGRGPVFSQ